LTFVDINKISRYGAYMGLKLENPRASGLLNIVARGYGVSRFLSARVV